MPKIIKQCYRDKTEQGSRHLFRFFMLTLLAESKTMAPSPEAVSAIDFQNHTPVFESSADAIMAKMESLRPSEISQILGISSQLAVKAHNLAFEFPNKLTGYKALFGFTGEAFKALDASSLPQEAIGNADSNLRFISSVYGLLKPDDIIKPYRCEFNKPIAPGNQTPIQLFKQKNTIELVNFIKENKINDIINLLPGDADKCIDWKIVRAFAKVHKICFQFISPDGKLKTPIAKKLKETRGLMARQILIEGVDSFKELIDMKSNHFIFSPGDSKPLLPVFITD